MNLANQVDARRRLIQKAHTDARIQEEGALEYIEAEMEGVTDEYAYTNTDFAQAKNFIPVGYEDKYNIITLTTKENKIDRSSLDRHMADIKSGRDGDENKLRSVMEENQIRAVLNYNNNN